MSNNIKPTKEYLNLFNTCPIKAGDTVTVLRGWKSGEYGYSCSGDYDVYHPRFNTNYVVTNKGYGYYEISLVSGPDLGETWYVPFFVLDVIKNEVSGKNSSTAVNYLAFHKASGLKVGDYVKVVRKAGDDEMGWNNTWTNKMDDTIGSILQIIGDCGINGWELDENWSYPTFVLQKVAPPTSQVNRDEIVIGSVTLSKKDVGRLYYKMYRAGRRKK